MRVTATPLILISCFAGGILGVIACSRPNQIDLPPVTSRSSTDGAIDSTYLVPSGKKVCNSNTDCDDSIDCTLDSCLVEGYCANTPDRTPCNDGIFCNGAENCDRTVGCVAAERAACDDGDPCTSDQCDELTRVCLNKGRDDDGDGEVDWHCPAGTDCDDRDPKRGSLQSEVCNDFIDNNCDGETDETGCGTVAHDRCEDALLIRDGEKHLLRLGGASADYGSCGVLNGRDVTLVLKLEEPRDIRVRAAGEDLNGNTYPTSAAITTDCEDPSDGLKCRTGDPVETQTRATMAGDYYVIVSSRAPLVEVQLDTSEPTTPPTNASCTSPLDISTGGVFHGSFVDGRDDVSLGCGSDASEDLIYFFTLSSEQNVEIGLTGQNDEPMRYELRRSCDFSPAIPDPSVPPDAGEAELGSPGIRCISGSPAWETFHQLPQGTYYLAVEGPTENDIDFDLSITLSDPTPPARGDSCDNPEPLTLGVVQRGTLADKQNMISLSCGQGKRDMVYRLDISDPTDLMIRVDGGEAEMTLALEDQCGVESDRCVRCQPALTRKRNLQPGTYYVVVEAQLDTAFLIIAEPLPLTVPVEISGNDKCETAVTVPPEGGVFTGNTAGMLSFYQPSCQAISAWGPDSVFKLELSETQLIEASVESSFASMLFRLSEIGEEGSACSPPVPDNCDSGGFYCSNSILEEVLPPGIYYYLVDGQSSTAAGRYIFELRSSNP
jgi:hypothetical protein